MKTHIMALAVALGGAAAASGAYAQTHFDRLPTEVLDVVPPSERVAGTSGQMRVTATACRDLPLTETRRRIVDLAVQEWAFFGFSIVDRTVPRVRFQNIQFNERNPSNAQRGRGRRGLSAEQFARLAPSIAGFWAATPDGAWMLDRQNDVSDTPRAASRWRDPWSAAFVSWVMCEAGLGSRSRFQRSIAHRDYIDQAIRARDGNEPGAAFMAYDVGEVEVIPGDLLCSGSRPDYQTIADRRSQMGDGARTHCDVVVKVDAAAGHFLAIGGNVGGTVSLKRLPAVRERGQNLHPREDIFAHLKLRADPIETDALEGSPTIRALGCAAGFEMPTQLASANLVRAANFC